MVSVLLFYSLWHRHLGGGLALTPGGMSVAMATVANTFGPPKPWPRGGSSDASDFKQIAKTRFPLLLTSERCLICLPGCQRGKEYLKSQKKEKKKQA